MKRRNKFFRVLFGFSMSALIMLLLASVASLFWAKVVLSGNNAFKKFPGLFNTVFFIYKPNVSINVLYQSIGNFFAFALAVLALVLFIAVLVKVKHNKIHKAQAAILSLALLVPAILGAMGGVCDFFVHGLKVLVTTVGGAKATLLAFMLLVTYVLDVIYVVFALLFVVHVLKEAKLVKQGIVPFNEDEEEEEEPEQAQPAQRPAAVAQEPEKEDKEKEHERLLKEIRQIVREELDRLDRVAIITETSEAPSEEPVEEEVAEEEAPVVEEVEAGKIPSNPRTPFAQKMVDADKDIQEKYNELKNEILAYGPSSRLSVSGDTFRLHRKAYVKITLVGKTLKVYFALNPNDYVDSPIPVFDAGDKSSYEDVPALLKVRSALSVKRAKELIDAAFAADGVEKGEVGNHNFVKDIRAELKANKK